MNNQNDTDNIKVIEENLLVENENRVPVDTIDNDRALLMNNGKLSYRLTSYRWLALFLACMCMFGSYYCYDNPQALQTPL